MRRDLPGYEHTPLHRTTAGYTTPRLGQKSFAASCSLVLLGDASYTILVHPLTVYDPPFLPEVDRPSAVALHFAPCGLFAGGLSPPGSAPVPGAQKRPSMERAKGSQQRVTSGVN